MKSRVWVNFEQQILALLVLLLLFIKLTTCHAHALPNQPISTLHFLNLQQMFLLQVKLITQGEKQEISTKTCNKTVLCNKLRFFCISYFAAFTSGGFLAILKKTYSRDS